MCSEGDLSVPVIAKVADFGLSSIAAATIQVIYTYTTTRRHRYTCK